MPIGIRPIKGAPGYYVTIDGRILSDYLRGGHGYRSPIERHELLPHYMKYGHCTVFMRGEAGSMRKLVHRIVAEHFIGPPPFRGAMVMHLDGNARNNRASNLRWGTAAQNCQMSANMNRMPFGEAHHGAKLTASSVRAARRDYARGERIADIARRLKVCHTTVHNVVTRKSWRRAG